MTDLTVGSINFAPSQVAALGAAIGKEPDYDGLSKMAIERFPKIHAALAKSEANDNDDGGSIFNRAMGLPSSNPKRAFGVKKPSAQFIPPIAIIEESVVMALGAAKYGAFNWQDDPVDATTYYSAAIRHLLQWFSGEDVDAESGASHLAHVRACMAILLDAQASDRLIDDRPKCAPAGRAIERLKVAA